MSDTEHTTTRTVTIPGEGQLNASLKLKWNEGEARVRIEIVSQKEFASIDLVLGKSRDLFNALQRFFIDAELEA